MPEDQITSCPLVSIVIPVYNAQKTLNNCLESVYGQAYENIEVILVDDGSKDDSASICKSFLGKYPLKTQYIWQENSGPATARNTGIQHASGDYLAFVDADDAVAPGYLKTMVEKAETNHADMVICAYWRKNGHETTEVTYSLPEGLYCGEQCQAITLSLLNENDGDIPPYAWVRLIRKAVFLQTGLQFHNGLIRSEDYHFCSKMHSHMDRIYLLSKTPLYYYVEAANSITHRYVKGYWKAVQFIYNDLLVSIPYSKEVEEKLDFMLIRRSLISLNNSARNKSIVDSFMEMREILNNKQLNQVIKKLENSKDPQFTSFRRLMAHHGKSLLLCKYLGRHISSKSN